MYQYFSDIKRGKEKLGEPIVHGRANLNYLLPPLNQQMNVEYAAAARPAIL